MARGKLKSALDSEKGRNFKLEKQRKYEKEARKRKDKRQTQTEDDDEDVEGGVPLDEVEVKVNGKTKKSKKDKKDKKAAPAVKEPDWETEGSDDEDASDDDDDEPERPALDLSHLEDSESDISSDEEELREEERADGDAEEAEDDEDEVEDEDEDDIALSDIESLASEDKGDIIPHQRLTINNTAALTAALNRIQLPYSKLAFSEYQSVVTDEPVDIPDVEDDLNRELAFYKQSLSAVKDARKKLKKEGTGFSRPADYFAEMVKSDEHMGKIKQKLIDEAAGKKASAEARKQRDLKKFGKQVQVAKMQERAKEKKDTLEKINLLKRKRQGAEIGNTKEEDLFDIALDNDTKDSDRRRSDGKSDNKRAKKDQKYGFGGKKRHAKSNTAESTADGRGFSAKRMKGKPTGGAKRPGKSVRMKKR
ncbi:eukaryotic rRNA processing protein EBP2-domain-containing protein [Paraphoma chrysanthemicola]|uniref:Eukaryotic rRNA processing protein EBP2-domain-containing protein n=1 Tax=Paraphoma chrysanthemicola TaxID=798071 RepID=A0A8K0R2Q2_9PLEO|nr:eukaryotic rRNA processing protein EBP2-domain-containing protein [Paraphoma chrysanthemicola]